MKKRAWKKKACLLLLSIHPLPYQSDQAARSSVGRAGSTGPPDIQTIYHGRRFPKEYADAEKIADHLKAMRPVVMNIEKTDDDEAERIVDFVQGVMYALDGCPGPHSGQNLSLRAEQCFKSLKIP